MFWVWVVRVLFWTAAIVEGFFSYNMFDRGGAYIPMGVVFGFVALLYLTLAVLLTIDFK